MYSNYVTLPHCMKHENKNSKSSALDKTCIKLWCSTSRVQPQSEEAYLLPNWKKFNNSEPNIGKKRTKLDIFEFNTTLELDLLLPNQITLFFEKPHQQKLKKKPPIIYKNVEDSNWILWSWIFNEKLTNWTDPFWKKIKSNSMHYQ